MMMHSWQQRLDYKEGVAAVQNEDGLWGYINEKGELVIPCSFSEATSFENGFAYVQFEKGDPFTVERYAIDKDGEVVLQCGFMNTSLEDKTLNACALMKQAKYKEAIPLLFV